MPEMQEIEGLRHDKVDEEKKRSVQTRRNQNTRRLQNWDFTTRTWPEHTQLSNPPTHPYIGVSKNRGKTPKMDGL